VIELFLICVLFDLEIDVWVVFYTEVLVACNGLERLVKSGVGSNILTDSFTTFYTSLRCKFRGFLADLHICGFMYFESIFLDLLGFYVESASTALL